MQPFLLHLDMKEVLIYIILVLLISCKKTIPTPLSTQWTVDGKTYKSPTYAYALKVGDTTMYDDELIIGDDGVGDRILISFKIRPIVSGNYAVNSGSFYDTSGCAIELYGMVGYSSIKQYDDSVHVVNINDNITATFSNIKVTFPTATGDDTTTVSGIIVN